VRPSLILPGLPSLIGLWSKISTIFNINASYKAGKKIFSGFVSYKYISVSSQQFY
jgi:hypothetical protein